MPFEKKFKNAGETKHIRVPIVYADLIDELMITLDAKYDTEKAVHLLRKFISNIS